MPQKNAAFKSRAIAAGFLRRRQTKIGFMQTGGVQRRYRNGMDLPPSPHGPTKLKIVLKKAWLSKKSANRRSLLIFKIMERCSAVTAAQSGAPDKKLTNLLQKFCRYDAFLANINYNKINRSLVKKSQSSAPIRRFLRGNLGEH